MQRSQIAQELGKKGSPPLSDPRLAAKICRALLSPVGMSELWGIDSPSDRAYEMLRAQHMAPHEQALLRIAFDLWNRGGEVTLNELLHLEKPHLRHIARLMLALAEGADSLERWACEAQQQPVTIAAKKA